MTKYHDVLLNQLHRLNIEWNKGPEHSHWLDLLTMISESYNSYEERHQTTESSLYAALEEINSIKRYYEAQLQKINTVSSDGILITDENWKITSLNHRGEILLGAKESLLVHGDISEKLLFLNSQKTPLDFNKLKYHFECGQNYCCSKGVIIFNENQNQELFTAFTITPSYLNGSANGYVISFRDISQEIIKEYDFRLSEVKNLALIEHSKSQQITWAQSIISNNHNGAMAAELKHLSQNQTMDKIEQYVLSYIIDSGIHTSNLMLTHSFSNDENKVRFLIQPLMEVLHSSIQRIIGSDRFTAKNTVNQEVIGDSYTFLEVIFEIITSVIKYFKSGTLTHIIFSHLNYTGLLHPSVCLKIQVDLSYFVHQKLMDSIKSSIESMLSKQPIDSMRLTGDGRTIEMQFDLKFYLAEDHVVKKSRTNQNMRCLFYLEDNSTLLQSMGEAFLLNHLDYIATHHEEEVVKKIKEARLNKNEFNVLISDKADFESLSQNMLQEIATYINDKFLGFIYVGDGEGSLHWKDIKFYPVKKSDFLKEMRQTLYSLQADFLIKSMHMPPLNNPLIPDNKRVLFINFEYYSQLLYTQLLTETGINFCLVSPEHLNSNFQTDPFHAILVNINHDLNALSPVLKQIKQDWPGTPTCMLLPPGDEKSITWILDNGIDHYLFKPFSLTDLSSLLQQLLSK